MARILVIDDEAAITDLLRRALSRDGHVVDALNNPMLVRETNLDYYDLVLCDVMMPGTDGFALVAKFRDLIDAPILFLTAKVTEEDVVRGLALGADDYIRKPFSVVELRAKVHAHLRREGRVHTHVLALGKCRFDLGARGLAVDGELVALTPTEYAVCEFLARHHGRALTRGQIREAALGWLSDTSDEAISMHVSNARAKLRAAGVDPIETVRGTGYKWQA